ncbi:hypothetical protein N8I84_28970 [Streptomyces cynarae]|uniref:Transposase n=1 Tax=Streptomyces cynarae TaxID=2981134 RepID=A0ABY6E792_9ACTN|nr:hypothetical protein [Streptomyces cynarae]UXY22278.1 hypothetical protein N8I84_28970 [Streptomyces cynarae]
MYAGHGRADRRRGRDVSDLGADGPTSAVTDGLNKDPAIDAVTGQLDGRKGEAPYRVPKTRIEEDFG